MELKNLYNLSISETMWIRENLEPHGTNLKELFREMFDLRDYQAVPVECVEEFEQSYRYHLTKYYD